MVVRAEDFTELQDRLRLDPSSFPDSVVARWRTELRDPTLRASLLDNPRLAGRIMVDICRLAGLEPHDDISLKSLAPEVRLLLDQDIGQLCLLLGAAWNWYSVAQIVTAGQAPTVLPDLSVEALRIALSVGRATVQSLPASEITQADLGDLGARALAEWLDALPGTLGIRIKYVLRWNAPFYENDNGPDTTQARADLVAAVLARLGSS